MAAEVLTQGAARVTIYDAMPSAGRKFLMAGRGGLNLTHSEALPEFLQRYGAAMPHLGPAVAAFPPDALRAWSEALGQPTFVGSSGRVFPESFKASPMPWACGWCYAIAGPVGMATDGYCFKHLTGNALLMRARACWRSAAQAGRGWARMAVGLRRSWRAAFWWRLCWRPIVRSASGGLRCFGNAMRVFR
jgi:hypothetical protein